MAKFAQDLKSPLPDVPSGAESHATNATAAGLTQTPSSTGKPSYTSHPQTMMTGGSSGGGSNPLWGNNGGSSPYDYTLKDPAARKAARK